MPRPASRQPTDAELKILKVLWENGPCGFGSLREQLGGAKPVVPSTLATMLKVMLEKGLLNRADGPDGYLWSAKVGQKATMTKMLQSLVDRAFDGSAQRLVAHLIETHPLTDENRAKLRALLDSHENPQ